MKTETKKSNTQKIQVGSSGMIGISRSGTEKRFEVVWLVKGPSEKFVRPRLVQIIIRKQKKSGNFLKIRIASTLVSLLDKRKVRVATVGDVEMIELLTLERFVPILDIPDLRAKDEKVTHS